MQSQSIISLNYSTELVFEKDILFVPLEGVPIVEKIFIDFYYYFHFFMLTILHLSI